MSDARQREEGSGEGAPALLAGRWLLPALFALSLILFAANASLSLTSDDVAWLHGTQGTAFDAHRVLPRLLFAGLRGLMGPSAPAALATLWLLHALNGWLLYRLACRLLAGRVAPVAALAVFLINPLTLGGLTWISCLAYVLGTTFALAGCLAAWQAFQGGGRSGLTWTAAALSALALGLGTNYDLLFVPPAWGVLGWLAGRLSRGLWLAAAGVALALPAGALVWAAADPGLDPWRLLSGAGALAYASSGLASGMALALAYPVSFFAVPTGFLQACFSEAARWALTALGLGLFIRFYHARRAWRTGLALVLCSAAFLVPFCARLILAPGEGSYHPTYLLSGRLYYLPFAGIALWLGHLAGELHRRLSPRLPPWLPWALPVAATLQALWLHEPADFAGLSMVAADGKAQPQAWAPFAGQQPAWLLLPLAAVALALTRRCVKAGGKEPARA
jgi:hypothetical protein